MSEKPTREEVLQSIVPKSDQLNADDLLTGPVTVTIEKVRKGDREQPIHIDLVEYPGKSFRPCKTVRRILIAAFSDDPKQWLGQRMTLYCDPEVKYGGVSVGGIRISHLSGIKNPRTFMLTQTRGKKSEVTIHPLAPQPAMPPSLTDEDREFIKATTEVLQGADAETLRACAEQLKEASKGVQDALRPVWTKRHKELSE